MIYHIGMRTRDVDILIIPGWTNAGPDHWQSRWERNLPTARRVEQADWDTPRRSDWVDRIVAAHDAATRPIVFVAHSCGVTAVAYAAPRLDPARVAGAFLVAPGDFDGSEHWMARDGGFAPMPMERLPFPSRLIASSDDPHCTIERAQAFADAWGSNFSVVANSGHLNTASGHGPWPEGLLTFGLFLKSLG